MKVHECHDHGLRPRQSSAEAIGWRRRSLRDAGFPTALAEQVAIDLRLDLHTVLQLVDRGCPPELAVRILLPLPGEVGP